VGSHDELERADQRFWQAAGSSERVKASLVLAQTVYALGAPHEDPVGLDRAVSAFADAGVQSLLVGGHAVAAHGLGRLDPAFS
jgi:hypothetical protein